MWQPPSRVPPLLTGRKLLQAEGTQTTTMLTSLPLGKLLPAQLFRQWPVQLQAQVAGRQGTRAAMFRCRQPPTLTGLLAPGTMSITKAQAGCRSTQAVSGTRVEGGLISKADCVGAGRE